MKFDLTNKLRIAAVAAAILSPALAAQAQNIPTLLTCASAVEGSSLTVSIVENGGSYEALIVDAGHLVHRELVREILGNKADAYVDSGSEQTFGLFLTEDKAQGAEVTGTLIHIASGDEKSISQRGLKCHEKGEISF